MGKKNKFTTRLLIAVDVSGSISDKEVQIFYSVIHRFFKYGIQSLDVLQFDTEVKEPLLTMQKAKKSVVIQGRGGTNFQPVIDFFENAHRGYDGLIVFTDGWASVPKMSPRSIRKTLWICSNKENFERHEKWMKQCGRCCWVREKN
jgi:predicted metal-dependent peptidase